MKTEFELIKKGTHNNHCLADKFGNRCVMTMRKSGNASIGTKLMEFFKWRGGSEALFAINDGKLYIADATNLEIMGLKVQTSNNKKESYRMSIGTVNKRMMNDGIFKDGIYELLPVEVYDKKNKISFYELVHISQ